MLIQKFRDAVYHTFSKRADATMDLLDALTVARHVDSPVALSEELPFRRRFSSVYDALEQTGSDPKILHQLLPVVQPAEAETIAGFRVYAVDTTPNERPIAETLPDRGLLKEQVDEPTRIGFKFSWLARLVQCGTSWIAPWDVQRVPTHQTENQIARQQVESLAQVETALIVIVVGILALLVAAGIVFTRHSFRRRTMNRTILLVLVTLLSLAVVAGCASLPPSPTLPPTDAPPPTPTRGSSEAIKYELVSDYCRHGQCLFVGPDKDFPIGIATIRGYFARVERTAWGETQVCDSFVIVGDSEVLIRFYLSLIDKGNTVNSKNQLNQPIINLDLSGLSESERQKLLASTAQNSISLLVLSFYDPKATEVGACYSFVEILRVVGANGAPAIPLQQLLWKGGTFWTRIKNKEYSVIISYPGNWYLDPNSDASHIIVQNVPPFNNPAQVPGGLPEGFAKFSFMIDPGANLSSMQAEQIVINGIAWRRQISSGELAGDRSMTLETPHEGMVYRIQTYITGTGGRGPIFDYQATILDQMIQSFRFGQ